MKLVANDLITITREDAQMYTILICAARNKQIPEELLSEFDSIEKSLNKQLEATCS